MSNDVRKYVLGFALSRDKSTVLLLRKNRPDFQAGKLNGIGGKIEDIDKTSVNAMIREFREETGIDTNYYDWQSFGSMNSDTFTVYLFWSILDNIESYQSMTDEVVQTFRISDLIKSEFEGCMPNLGWLIMMLRDPNLDTLLINTEYK